MPVVREDGDSSRLSGRKWNGHVSFLTDLRVQCSFNETSLTLAREFRRERLLVTFAPRATPLPQVKGADILLAHPGWSAGAFVYGSGEAAKRFGLRGMIDVLNYSHPGPKARFELSHPFWDFIAVHHITTGLEDDEREGKVVRWDLGLPREYAAPLGPVHKVPRILIWGQNGGWERKGHDLHARILAEAQRRGYEFETYIKTPFLDKTRKWFADVRGVRVVLHYLDRRGLLRLYDSMDVLLHLQRGGGWEMCPMEAIGRGLVAVVPDQGAVMEYARGCSVEVATHEWAPPQDWIASDSGRCDAGVGYEADYADALDSLLDVLTDWPKARVAARRNQRVFYDRWRIERVMPRNWGALADKLHLDDGVLAKVRTTALKN